MKTSFVPLSALIMLAASCTHHSNKPGDASPAPTLSDTVTAAVSAGLPPMLPDTAYPSARAVKFDIHIPDTTVSGTLSSTADLYADTPGAFTFRKGSRRDASFGGRLAGRPSEITVDWVYSTPYDTVKTRYGRWGGGTGWTGQPLYVHWPDSCMKRLRSSGAISGDASGKEIIVGSLDRKVHFIDYVTGRDSRQPIGVDNPIKGTTSLDPTLNGNLYVGHGVPATTEMGALVIDLFSNRRTHFYGRDPRAQRGWNAYDSSPLRVGQFLFRPGENGTLYKWTVAPGHLKLHSSLRYTVGGRAPGMEASIAVYRNYGYTADNAGNILCINLNTLRPVWHFKLPDDVDASPVIAEEDDGVYLYAGCEVEHEGVTHAEFVKLDALTGKHIWVNRTEARRCDVNEKHFDGGFYATPLPGMGNCSHLIFNNVVANTDGQNGRFIAMDRKTGKTVYAMDLRYYAWSSPVGFLDNSDRQYVVTGDCAGRIYLIDGVDGTLIASRQVGSNFESSPVVVDSSLVVGSRGTDIYKLTIR